MDDDVIRDGREIVDNIVASLNQHHASSSPEHQAEWDELLRMQNTPSPRGQQQQQQSQRDLSLSSRSMASSSDSPSRFRNSSGGVAGRFETMGRPSTVLSGSAGSVASVPLVGERSSSVFATSPAGRHEMGISSVNRRSEEREPLTTPVRTSRSEVESQTSSSRPRRLHHITSTEPAILDSSRSRTVHKDSDDPSLTLGASSGAGFTHTPASLTKLLGANVSVSPIESRQHSYNQGNINLMRRSTMLDGATLPDHLYTQGLLAGRHSDIRILAFGNEYNLHRLILDRAPFFTLALSGPWIESRAQEIVLHPDQVDQAITQNAFELALKRLYGCDISDEEDAEAIGLFATGCWLEMQELIDSSVESILRQMEPENLALLIKLVTNNYYGRPGERILSSAKAMLCRNGSDMPLEHWEAIPGHVVQEVVSSDGFFVVGEWERWNHAKKLLDSRLKHIALESGVSNPKKRLRMRAPESLLHELPRFKPHATTSYNRLSRQSVSDDSEAWHSIYLHPEVESICELLDTGIHYLHMDFEHLQYIRQTRDIFGLPVVPEAIISEALFQQLELRQRIVNAQGTDLELGLAQQADDTDQDLELEDTPEQPFNGKGIMRDSMVSPDTSPEGPAKFERFWIPSEDCTMIIGGTPDPIVTLGTTSGTYSIVGSSTRQSDSSWSDMSTQSRGRNAGKASGDVQLQPASSSYSTLPPFRFSAEFPSPRLLKEKKRIYSRTVFYAGSYWNIYIQKMRSVKQNFQLGVYLHRAKDREQEDAISTGANFGPTTVDERIGLLEREMLTRGGDRSNPSRHHLYHATRQPSNESSTRDNAASGSSTQGPTAGSSIGFSSANQDRNAHSRFSDATLQTHILFDSDSEDDEAHAPVNFDADADASSAGLLPSFNNLPFLPPAVATLPPYTDTRPTIRTYFKIYSPSKAGRLLSVYESAPDHFDFSQSWGWRSSTLMLDEGFGNENDDDPLAGLAKKNRNTALRFSVVIGNL